jgi:predicted  nucleic acid-binding Zn-ribbon protein
MGIDELPQQFDALVEAARVALHHEIGNAKNIVAAANAEKASVQSALSNLQAQIRRAQSELAAVTRELQRSTVLHGVGGAITKAREELERLKAETEAEREALVALKKEQTERQKAVNALNDEVSGLSKVRAYNQEEIAKIRHQFGL